MQKEALSPMDESRISATASSQSPAPGRLEDQRYVLIDAFRGFAALAVVLFHLVGVYTPLRVALTDALPGWLTNLLRHGSLGVQVFFVISGFVIAHSVRTMVVSRRTVFLFILRRQLRLDPPYWAALTLQLVYLHVWYSYFGAKAAAPPPVRVLVLNSLYLHRIFDVPSILFVSWTLCIEIQFYLFFVALLWLCQVGRIAGTPTYLSLTVIVAAAILFPLIPLRLTSAWMLPFWGYFAAGSLCYWSLRHPRCLPAFAAITLVLAFQVVLRGEAGTIVGLATAAGFYVAGRAGGLTRWTLGKVSQYLGRISYSLYLTHSVAITGVLSIAWRLGMRTRFFAILGAVAAIGVSLVLASFLSLLVERPSNYFSAKLKAWNQPGK